MALVADARPVIAAGLATALMDYPPLVAEAVTTETELITAVESHKPRVIVVLLDRDGRTGSLLRSALDAATGSVHVIALGSQPQHGTGPSEQLQANGLRGVVPTTASAQALSEAIATMAAPLDTPA